MSVAFQIKNKIRRLPLKGAMKAVLKELAEFANEYGGSIFPSYNLLAENTGISRRHVIRVVEQLCKEGYIIKSKHRFYKSNYYQLVIEFIQEQFNLLVTTCHPLVTTCHPLVTTCHQEDQQLLVTTCHPLVTTCHLASDNMSPKLSYNYQLTNYNIDQKFDFSKNKEQIQEPEISVMQEKIPDRVEERPVEPNIPKPLPTPTEKAEKKPSKVQSSKVNLEEQFNQWYEIYPKHEARKKGYEAFMKAWPKVEFSKLIELTKAYARSVEGKDKQYLPLPASWLNGERWKDDSIAGYVQVNSSSTPPSQAQTSASVVQVEDENLREFLEAHPNLDGKYAFQEATLTRRKVERLDGKFEDQIIIQHANSFNLTVIDQSGNGLLLKEFFGVSDVIFTTQEQKKIFLAYPPPERTAAIQAPVEYVESPSRYRTLNENYQAAGSKTVGGALPSLASMQREYQQKLKTQMKTG